MHRRSQLVQPIARTGRCSSSTRQLTSLPVATVNSCCDFPFVDFVDPFVNNTDKRVYKFSLNRVN